jgi:NADH-quinone oxidoreductase subunit L
MIFCLGLGLFIQCFFHLLTHAVAKANLFVKVGFLMIKKNHHQDSRILTKNHLNKILSSVFCVYSIFSLSGVIFFSGFFSKEKIIEKTKSLNKIFVLTFIYLVIFFSLFYGFRLIYLLKFNQNQTKNFFGTNDLKILRVFVLSFFSVFLGKILKFYFLKFSFSTKILKIIYYLLFIVCFLVFLKKNFY